ncbi:hypothetical protein IQ268_18230 [Oculatella sp. LEGE 06141]|uniref:hypothetical protein n=1 Tax=Oculatella sp. LEGE 06141 TaxID=1828648 RepID=UPI0018817A4E|nr:hypothetical protein [Oculatella sp. LEGE 06141]MBE9180503.1 hypothetical protein [Oculatella sp. LEGE 06141]
MSNLFTRSTSPWRTLLSRYSRPITGALLTVGMTTVGLPSLLVRAAEAPETSSQASLAHASSTVATLVSQSADAQTWSDGIYLYGQANQPDQLGSAYMVFEVNDNQVVGAFYMPQSSFDCFYGNLEANEMALTVVDSYEQTAHPYSVALESTSDVADAGNPTLAPTGIEGFNRIDSVSDNDQRMLQTCTADYQERAQ